MLFRLPRNSAFCFGGAPWRSRGSFGGFYHGSKRELLLFDTTTLTRASALSYSATAQPAQQPPLEVAVLGGGITGLTAAFTLADTVDASNINITLFETQNRLGGWLNSKSVTAQNYAGEDNGTIIFEEGPRTLRPTGIEALFTKYLIRRLGLENEVLTPSSDAHNNRYIFWPDRLVRMPHPDDGLFSIVRQLLREPLFRNSGVFKPWTEFAAPPRPDSLEDESVGSFFARRVNAHVVDHILSAGLHGIYAGDCYQLSMKSLFPKLWAWEREYGSLGKALQQRDASKIDVLADDHALLMDFREQGVLGKPAHWDKAALYSFRGGVSTLVRALEKRLRSSRNVKIRTATTIAMMVPHRADHGGGIEIVYDDADGHHHQKFTHVISTIPGNGLQRLVMPPMPLYAPHAVSVAVVSLYYPEPNVLPARGFGYLIPRSVPFALNSERALGVVFDSDAVPGLESSPATPLSSPSSSSSPSSPPTPQPPRQSGTMVTVMLGGHWWDGWTAFPDEREAALDACAVLQRQLRVTAVPTMVSVSLQRDCIPQYTVGHAKRLSWLHSTVRGSFRGRLRLAGSAYGGVSVNQCVKAGITAAAQLASQPDESLTGLETLVDPQYRTINREWLKQL